MKNLIILLLFLFVDHSDSDIELETKVYGTWIHDASYYPSGMEERYYKEFTFYRDSLDYRGIWRGDTVELDGYWYIEDSLMYMYTVYADTTMLTNIAIVKDVLEDSLVLVEPRTDRISYYLKQ